MKKTLLLLTVLFATVAASQAGVRLNFGIGIPLPGVVYAPPAPVVVTPPVYGAPPPVYAAPPPVYAAPPPVVVAPPSLYFGYGPGWYGHYGWGHRHGWYRR